MAHLGFVLIACVFSSSAVAGGLPSAWDPKVFGSYRHQEAVKVEGAAEFQI